MTNTISSSGASAVTVVGGFCQPDGKGKLVWKDGSFYVGDWVRGRKHGFGKYRFANGEVYDGEWRQDVKEGDGSFSWTDGSRQNSRD